MYREANFHADHLYGIVSNGTQRLRDPPTELLFWLGMTGSFVLEFLGPLSVFVSVLVETIHNLKVPFAHFSHSQVTYSALRIMLQAFYFLV